MFRKNTKKTVKVSKGDYRVGNFVVHTENGYVKISDLSGLESHRVSEDAIRGQALFLMLSEGREDFLHYYCAVMHKALTCVPDVELLHDIDLAIDKSVDRNKALYGIKDDITPKEDAEILKEEKELNEAVEELKSE